MIVAKKTSFDAAHWLPGYDGKCANMHGHHWIIEIAVEGEVGADGMVIDFTELKGFLSEIKETFDHHIINDVITNPTAENIALWIGEKLVNWESCKIDVKLKWVKVWETENSYAMLS